VFAVHGDAAEQAFRQATRTDPRTA
jgi:hypothetical protein